jgi:hypothetical protein
MRSVVRTLTVLVTVGVVAVFTITAVAIWQDEYDLQHHGARAHVPVLSIDKERRRADAVRVRMPDGSEVTIDTYGPAQVGHDIEVVYWPDDPDGAEFPGWPNGVAVIDLALGALVDLIGLAVLYGLLVPSLRRVLRRRPGAT